MPGFVKIIAPGFSDDTEKINRKIYKSKGPSFISLKSDNKIGKNW